MTFRGGQDVADLFKTSIDGFEPVITPAGNTMVNS
jgi:hypothetical protein